MATWYNQIGGLRAFWDSGIGGQPINYPLWYVRDLIVFVILAPLVFYSCKITGSGGLLFLYIAYLFHTWKDLPGLSMEGFFFFTFGAFLKIRSINISYFFKKRFIIVTCLAIPTVLIMVFTYGNNNVAYRYAYRLFTLFGSSSIIGFVTLLVQKQKINIHPILLKSSFFVYASHIMVLPYVLISLGNYLPSNQIGLIIKYFLAPIITVIILIVCYYYANKWIPKTLSVLTGGRE